MSIDNGSLVGEQIVVTDTTGSYQQLYDAAGHLTGSLLYSTIKINGDSSSSHVLALSQNIVDLRGRTISTLAARAPDDANAAVLTTQRYDDDGRLLQTLTFDLSTPPVQCHP